MLGKAELKSDETDLQRHTGSLRRAVADALAGASSWGLIPLLLLLPWPLGSVRAAPSWLMVIAVWILLVVRAVGLVLRRRARTFVPASLILAFVLALGVLVWAAIQALPVEDHRLAHPLRTLVPTDRAPSTFVSLDPDRTIFAVARLSAYVALSLLAFLAARRRHRAETLLNLVLAIIALEALFGLLRSALAIDEWFGLPLPLARTSGSFVNPNHYAAYVNLGLVALFVLVLADLRQQPTSGRLASGIADALRVLFERKIMRTLTFTLFVMASFASASRGAFFALILALPTVAAVQLGQKKLAIAAMSVLVGLGGLLIMSAGTTLLERLEVLFPASELEPSSSGRLAAFELALRAWQERPWLGHGLGTWPAVFHALRDERFPLVVFDYAHNTWLELLAELGAPAMFAWSLSLVLVAVNCLRAYGRSREPLPLVGFACGLVLALHSVVDFPAQIPAVAATFAVLFGLAAGRAAVILARPGGSVRRPRGEEE